MMDHRVQQVIKAFEENVWQLIGSTDVSGDWWFQDIIHLKSVWHPVGTNLYLTLLTDPQITDRKEVWSIGFSKELPQRHSTHAGHLTLNDIKRTDLASFAKKMNSMILAK